MKTIHRKSMLFLTLVIILVSACSPQSPATEQSANTEVLETAATVTEAPTLTPSPTPTPTPLPMNGQETQYNIDMTIDYYNQFISATSQSIYTNKSDSPIHEMVFIVYPERFQSISIKSIRLGDGTAVSDYDWDSLYLSIPLNEPLLPGTSIEITFDFELHMPNREGIFSYNGKELNLSYFFPMIPYYDPESGWVTHEIQVVNTFIGEFIVLEPSDFNLNITFTDNRENLTVAAPAPAEETDGALHYHVDLARTLTLSISDQFSVTEREVNGVKILAYSLNEHAWIGEDVADVAVQAVTLFSDLFGEYNREVLSIVEFNATIGMEFDGLVFLGRDYYLYYPDSPRSNIHVYTAHEIAHQWFFAMVGNDQAMEPWLDEAFATYAQKLFYDQYYPEDAAWMWESYITAWNPQGDIDISIYFGGDDREYRKIVYLHGALFLQDLRETLGDETFFAFLRDYVETYQYEIVTTQEFWTFLQSYTDLELTALHDEYFQTPLN